VTRAQEVIDAAIAEIERLHKTLRSDRSVQVRSDDERQAAKALALAYFNSHRPVMAAVLGEHQMKSLDEGYRFLIAASGRATLRSKYLAALKFGERLLKRIQADHVLALSAPAQPVAASSDVPPAFAPLVVDPRMQKILQKRWSECTACVNAGAPLAAIVMMGGLLEGLLLARINQLTDKSPVFKAASAPKDNRTGATLKLNEWGLKNYLDVAHELDWISRATKDIGEVVRDYRNYIHPQKEHSHGIVLTVDDARTLWEIAKSVLAQVLK
jgi:hypothetical protein